jgi:site-specific recombinase XerC
VQIGAIIGTVDLIDCVSHSNISTTQRYMHLDDQELADAQDLVD